MPSEILQLSDLHLMADPDAALKGIRTRDSFNDVLRFVRKRELAGEWKFDHILLTGDLAHDERLETYETLRELLGDWITRCHLIPGNHDDRKLIRQVFPELAAAGDEFISFSVQSAGWRLVGLDSHVEGETHGRIGEGQLQWLSEELSTHVAQPTILFIHHPPVPVHSAWLDRIGLGDADALLEVARSFSQVRVISSGHVHQEFQEEREGLKIVSTPSTGVQFLPRGEELALDPIPPGFRLFRLFEDRHETEVIRAQDTD